MKRFFTLPAVLQNKNPLWLAIAICLPYWLYLTFFSSMFIDSDAKTYENLGNLIAREGWKEYFLSGPHREPLYPLLIAFSMRLADILAVPYLKIQTIFQIGILILTQALMYKILKKLNISRGIILAVLLYWGFSPAIVNSAFSLYSEIITYPFTLAIVWLAAQSWIFIIRDMPFRRILPYSIALGLALAAMVFIKGIFEIVIPLLTIPFLILLIRGMIDKNKKIFTAILFYLLTLFVTVYTPVTAYKYMNKIHNHHFTLTNRGPWAIYGNTVRRMERMTPGHYLGAVATVPGEGVCRSLAGKEECYFWSALQSDDYGHRLLKEWTDIGIAPAEQDDLFIAFTKAEIAKNPPQYGFFMLLEGLKMFFWESTNIGWVIYPEGLNKIFTFKPFNNGLRLLASLATFWGLWQILIIVAKNRVRLTQPQTENNQDLILLFFILYLIFAYAAAHSFFFVLTRYAFPMVPLYLILIACSINRFRRP